MNVNKLIILGLSIFLWFGCEKPGPIEIIDNQDDSNLIEMKTIGNSNDSLFVNPDVDSSALIDSYFGKLIVVGVRHDAHARSDSFIKAEAIFLDKSNPIRRNNFLIAYPSLDMGCITLNSDTLLKVQRQIRIGARDSIIGYRYHLRKPYEYTAGQEFQWQGSGNNGISAFNILLTLPPEIRVREIIPRYISVNDPMHIKWNCDNQYVFITISREAHLVQRAWVPIFQLRIKNIRGAITIPTKILSMLPTKRYQRYLFTFSSESKDIANIDGYPDNILVHSASIHNIILDVRN